MKKQIQGGFTLIELLIVIALIAVLAGAVIIALNPARQFQNARDSERWSHVSAISNAIQQNIAENKGTWTCGVALPASATDIKSGGSADICSCLVPNYTAALPVDPQSGSYTDCSTYDSGYTVMKSTVGSSTRITVGATGELTPSISVTQ